MTSDKAIRESEGMETNTQPRPNYKFCYLISPGSAELKDQFLNSPIKLGIALKSSQFAEVSMDKPTFNKGAGSMIIRTEKPIEGIIAKLGTWKISCKDISDKIKCQSYGVIGPISEDEDVREILKELKESEYKVEEVIRLEKKAGKNTIATQCLKIGFSCKELPTHIKIWDIPFRVRRYIPLPKQCYKCQGFGHFATNCRKPDSCLYCGENQVKL